jgi:hypothetical protein
MKISCEMTNDSRVGRKKKEEELYMQTDVDHYH